MGNVVKAGMVGKNVRNPRRKPAAGLRLPVVEARSPDQDRLADVVAATADIRSICLAELYTSREDDARVDGVQLVMEAPKSQVARMDDPADHFGVKLTLAVRTAPDRFASSSVSPAFVIRATFRIVYSARDLGVLTNKQLAAFAARESVHHVWTFWRELLASTTSRMDLPPLLLPLHRPIYQPERPTRRGPE